MLTLTEAMDESTMVSKTEAIREIKKHGFADDEIEVIEHRGGKSLVHRNGTFTDQIARVVDGEVSSADVLRWLGY